MPVPPCHEPAAIRYDDRIMALYLITGIGGFIGSSLARALLQRGEQVRGVDNFSTGKRDNICRRFSGRIDFREADLLDLDAMRKACAGADYVLHQAAIPSVPKSVLDPLGSNRANLDGTVNLLVAARDAKVKRVVYAASSSAYGDTPTLPKHERMAPGSDFAVCGRQAGRRALHDFVLPLLRAGNGGAALFQYFRPAAGSIFALLRRAGQVHHPDAARRAAHDFWRRRAEPRLHLHRQCVEANLLACHAPADRAAGQMFNVATGRRVTLNETFKLLQGLTGYSGPPAYGAERSGDIKHSLADISKAQQALGYKPTVRL